MARRSVTPGRAILGVLALLVAWGAQQLIQDPGLDPGATPPTASAPAPARREPASTRREPAGSGGERILELFEQGRSDVVVEASGVIEKMLSDDEHGSRHQRIILRVAGDHTILLSHNIDLAPRVPAHRGDRLSFRGEYEWNDRGGVVHWTHHDPQRRRPGGWIEHDGKRYD